MYDYLSDTFPSFFLPPSIDRTHCTRKSWPTSLHWAKLQSHKVIKNGVLGFICFIIAQFMLPTLPCLTLLLHPSKVQIQSSHILVPLRKTINSTLLKDVPKTIFGTRSLEEQLPSSYTKGIDHPSSHTRWCAQPSITLANLSAPMRSNRMGSLQ